MEVDDINIENSDNLMIDGWEFHRGSTRMVGAATASVPVHQC